MTTHALIEQENDYLQKGFNEVLIKPFSKKDLLRALKRNAPQGVAEIVAAKNQAGQTPDNGVSAALAALIPQVLDSIGTEITAIKKALYENDQDSVVRTSHAVKGLAEFYGFGRLSGLLEHLEDSVRKCEYRTAYALADALGSHVHELLRIQIYKKNELAN